MRVVIYDTETTGKEYQKGHRLVEIGMVEIIDGKIGRKYHSIINPERVIPDEVIAIHGITNEVASKAPKFKEIKDEIVEFLRGSYAVAHNSEFDEKFINNELELCKHEESFWSIVDDTKDSIEMSRRIWMGKDPNDPKNKNYKHTLDAVLDRCHIDRSRRVHHGALLDAELLADAFLCMEKMIKELGPTLEDDVPRSPIERIVLTQPLISVSSKDIEEKTEKKLEKISSSAEHHKNPYRRY